MLSQKFGVFKANINTALIAKPLIASAVEAFVDNRHKAGSNKRNGNHGSRENRFMLMTSINEASKTQHPNKISSL
jgi:hypothetical protein